MRIGISGTHGTGKTTLAEALCACLPGHITADEPYYLLEGEGYEFEFPPSPEDYRALLARSVRSLTSPPLLRRIIFDRTPLDYLAYMAATGAGPQAETGTAALQSAFGSLDLLVITPITPETEQLLPPAEMPRLRSQMNDRAGPSQAVRPPGLNAQIITAAASGTPRQPRPAARGRLRTPS
jgi:hypothetical protein